MDLDCNYSVLGSLTADQKSFNLNPVTDLNLSLHICAHTVWRKEWYWGAIARNRIIVTPWKSGISTDMGEA